MSAITDSIVVPGSPGELHHLNAFLGAFWERHALPPGDAMRMELGLEEVFIIVVTHGLEWRWRGRAREGGPEPEGAALGIETRACSPWRPLCGHHLGMETRHLGGLGIHPCGRSWMRCATSAVAYNRLVMTASWPSAPRLCRGCAPRPPRSR
jgi:hypothetical protein